jgi:hypothetical protein
VATFDQLSDLDFEEVVADLLQAETGLRFSARIRGADAGIDVLASDACGGQHVVQCKHYLASSASKVRSAARREAAVWREREKPASYRFVTSRRLTHANRDQIAEILAGLVTSIDDVLGATQLDQLVRKHSEVEARHVKLWLGGAGQLRRLLKSGVYERSAALVEEIRRLMPRYVETERYLEARRILHTERVCVIAGAAGVGKTTIARLLLIDSLEAGFSLTKSRSKGSRKRGISYGMMRGSSSTTTTSLAESALMRRPKTKNCSFG